MSFESKIGNNNYIVNYFPKEDWGEKEVDKIIKELEYGDKYIVYVEEINDIENSFYNTNSFNYKGYMLSKKISKQIVIDKLSYVGQEDSWGSTFLNKLKNFRKRIVLKISEEFSKNSVYINSLVFGEKIVDENLKNNIQMIGIVQLFTISGLHINFLIELIEKILKKFRIQQKYIDFIIIVFLPIYGVLCNMGVSIKRVIEMKYLEIYFKYKGESQSNDKFKIWTYVFILNIVLNPFNLLNIGFVFSYFITLFLILNKEILANLKNDFLKNYYISTFLLPFSININYNFNIFIFFSLKYYDYLVKYMMIVSMLIVLTLNIHFISLVFNNILNILVCMLNILNFINLKFVLVIKRMGLLFIIVYYYIFYKQMEEYYYYKETSFKYMKIMVIILLVFSVNINILGKVDIIDVGQGDSILIKYPLNGKTVLIDTGDEGAKEEIVEHLKSVGITKIDYLILTHNHMDHVANMEDILLNFKVKNIVVNENYYKQYPDYFKSDLFEGINIITISGLEHLPIGYVYCQPVYEENENNNSIVLYTKLGFHTWLFMGDVEQEIEKELVDKYNLDVDYVKLGHHGSKTSTTEEFLEETSPLEAFISSGRDNMYGHPSKETIDKLNENNIRYENTQQEGEIVKYFI